MRKILNLVVLLAYSIVYSQGSGNIINSINVPASVSNPSVLIGANPVPSGTWKVYIKNDIIWETYNINGLETYIYTKSDVKYKPITYSPTYSEIIASLGYTPYNNSNPSGYINAESDPIWSAAASSYRTKNQNDLIYQPIGTYVSTETDPTVPSYSKTLSAFSVIKSSTDPLYVSLSGSYTDPSFIVSIPYSKITGVPSPPVQVNSDWNSVSGVSQILNKPVIPASQVQTDWNASTGLGVLLNKPVIPTDNSQLINGNGYITASSTNTLTNKSGNISQWTNNSGYLTSVPPQSFSSLTGKPTSLSGYGITDAYPLTGNPSNFLTSISSGQVTGALGYTPLSAEVDGSITNEIQSLSIVGSTISLSNGGGSVAVPGTVYSAGTGVNISSNIITNTAPDQTVTLTAGNRISITGTYPNFTIAYVEPAINIVTRTTNSNFTVSSTKQALVTYTLTCQVTNPLLVGTSTAMAYLEYSTNAGSTWSLPSQNGNSSGVGITVTLQLTNGQTGTLIGYIPANALVRIRTATSGTGSVTYVTGQETY